MTTHPIPLQFDRVWKRYQIGSKHDSLRDTIPALVRRLTGRDGDQPQPGEFWALHDVSFKVKRGETIGIIGHNGAGKSTVLKLLSKICKQTKGTIRVNGLLAALIEVGAGFHPDLTGHENIYLNGTIMGLRHKQINRLYDSIVEFSELKQFLDMPVKRYSSGMAVRLGFAVAAHVEPQILLVDEVLAVGDLSFQQKCYQRILDLKARGTTIIFISHNLEAVQRLCDRVLLMEKGAVLKDGEPGDTILYYRQEVLRKAFQNATAANGSRAAAGAPADIEIVTSELLDQGGAATDTFETGEPMRVRLEYATKRPIRSPSITITLERLDGLVCHEASTVLSGIAWNTWDGRGELTLRYPELNLLPNTYQANVAVYEGQNPAPLVRMRHQLYFHITSTKNMRGTVHLDHEWLDGDGRTMTSASERS
jgi:lipopolysaccharide transport system ATP-binding protein